MNPLRLPEMYFQTKTGFLLQVIAICCLYHSGFYKEPADIIVYIPLIY
jgi:hypothetical protein